MDVIIPTNLVCVLFDSAIPTSSFNYIVFFIMLVYQILYYIIFCFALEYAGLNSNVFKYQNKVKPVET